MKKTVIVLILIIISISCKHGPTQQVSSVVAAVPSPSTVEATVYVTDNAGVIDDATQKQLETTLAALKAQKKIDFAVVTVTSIDDNPIYDYSLGLAQERKKERDRVEQNNAMLLLLVSVDDRKWHVQITRDLESHLTNEILRGMSIPMTDAFRQKQYGEGISKYVNAVIAKLDQLGIR